MSNKKWPSVDEVDGETEQLMHLVDNGWCWEWPGWKWVAESLNSEFENNRTPSACRNKYDRVMKGRIDDRERKIKNA